MGMLVSFDALMEKVRQAEVALEAKERQTVAHWRQVKVAWRSAWTPGRIVVAGLVSGFVVGRAEPFKRAAGGGALQLISALSGLFASGSAQAAAAEASSAADTAQASDVANPPPSASSVQAEANLDRPPYELPESFRDSGHL